MCLHDCICTSIVTYAKKSPLLKSYSKNYSIVWYDEEYDSNSFSAIVFCII